MWYFKMAPRWLQSLVIVLLVLGIFFRFFNLDGKVYRQDETYTTLRVSGYTIAEVKPQLLNNGTINNQAFAKFQRLNPQKGLIDTVKSLAIENPQNPPLYYIIARLWVQIFGTSVTALRSLSATISLLVFPCAYWLCCELFKVPLSVPLITISLMAISPMHLLYAQEAGEYILWAVTILLCSASLLRAIRLESIWQKKRKRIFNWVLYGITLTLSLYTFLLSGLVAIAHVTYVIIREKFRSRTINVFLVTLMASFLSFLPWVIVILYHRLQIYSTTNWTETQLTVIPLAQSWLIQISRIFFDLNFGFENPITYLITPVFLTLVGYSIYFLYRTTHPTSWLFIVTLIAIPALPLMLPDIMSGGIRSVSGRDLIPSYLGIQLAVAYLLAYQLYNGIPSRKRIWQTILNILILFSIVSCIVFSLAETWWS
jgi:uncharacterized membrane protein